MMSATPKRQAILLVEDNDDHAELIQRSFEGLNARAHIVRLRDGEEAIDYLFGPGTGLEHSEDLPVVVLLDLRLPRVDGLEVLRRLKESTTLRRLPVVILTTSEAEADVARAYQYHANAYLVKPLEYIAFNDLLRDLGLFWLVWNKSLEPV